MNITRFSAIAAVAVSFSLSACQNEPETAPPPGGADPLAKELANAAPVTLPPAIRDSKVYRCKDNSVVYVNFLDDGVTANVRSAEDEPPRQTLTAPAAGEAFAGGGFSLSGSGESVTFASPDVPGQTCKA